MNLHDDLGLALLAPAERKAAADFFELVLFHTAAMNNAESEMPAWILPGHEDQQRILLALGMGAILYAELLTNLECKHQSVGELMARLRTVCDAVRSSS